MWNEFLSQSRHETAQAELRGRVGGGERNGHETADGNVGDHRAAFLAEKNRDHGGRSVHRAEQIDLHDAAVFFDRRALKRAEKSDASVVDPHIDAAKRIERLLREILHRVGIGDIGRHRTRVAAERGAFAGNFLQRFGVACCKNEARAFAGKRDSRGASDSAGGSGDDDDLIAQRPVDRGKRKNGGLHRQRYPRCGALSLGDGPNRHWGIGRASVRLGSGPSAHRVGTRCGHGRDKVRATSRQGADRVGMKCAPIRDDARSAFSGGRR